MHRLHPLLLTAFALFSASVSGAAVLSKEPLREAPASSGRFQPVAAEESGLTEENTYADPRMWKERYLPSTAGAVGTGVAVGDFTGDGRPDLFLAFRESRNRLYRNDGDLQFTDITEERGLLESPDWTTGVAAVDIDGDGDLDIHVCFYDAPNRVYLNDGTGHFEEAAARLGLAVTDASNTAAFADYDRDGDLDLYLQTNQLGDANEGNGRPDSLFRNDGPAGFTDVTREAGIKGGADGATLGHSVLWIDFDGDGWDDLYVANDFEAPDFLYRNQGDGTFVEAGSRLPVVPYSSMGSDVGDVNNDGLLDLLVTDMATPDYGKHAVSMLPNGTKTHALPSGERPVQLMKNALLLNRGGGDFIDLGYAWNLAASDWTWAARLVDLDNDGWLDALFTNGMLRQFHNADLSYQQDEMPSIAQKNAVFPRSPVLNEDNRMLRNLEGKGFLDASEAWGFRHHGVSFGAAVSDLDGDGDLDLVHANFNAPHSLWRNDLQGGNAVLIELKGRDGNSRGIGATAIARFGGRAHARKLLATRGYQSTDGTALHFGLGSADRIDTLEIHWPDGSVQTETDLESGHRYLIEQDVAPDAAPSPHTTQGARFALVDQRPAGASAQPAPDRHGPLYPFKPLPGPARPSVLKADFDGDGRPDALHHEPWEPVELILDADGVKENVSLLWIHNGLAGHWERAAVLDANGDGRPDVLLGGLGLNNDVAYRGRGEPLLVRQIGTFPGRGKPINLCAMRWDGAVRIIPGLIELAAHYPALPVRFGSFRMTGEVDNEGFIERSGFEVAWKREIHRLDTVLLLNQAGGGFVEHPLPVEAQWGRVRDIATGDVDRDGHIDLILLLEHVSPHPGSSQPDPAFLSVFLGNGRGGFLPDPLRPTDEPIGHDLVSIHWAADETAGDPELMVTTLDGGRLVLSVSCTRGVMDST